MDKKQKKTEKLLKFFFKNIIGIEKNVECLTEYLNKNTKVLYFQAETKDLFSLQELAEILELKSDETCEQMYWDLEELYSCEEDIDERIDEFFIKYI